MRITLYSATWPQTSIDGPHPLRRRRRPGCNYPNFLGLGTRSRAELAANPSPSRTARFALGGGTKGGDLKRVLGCRAQGAAPARVNKAKEKGKRG